MPIRDIKNDWRDKLVPATFRGVVFRVEVSGVQSGRRTVVHEYPKRNDPYSEDMGRIAHRWSFTAYVLHRDPLYRSVTEQRDSLKRALEADDAGTLVHPSLGEELVMCERYTVNESRERGGYYEFDLQFVEAGRAQPQPQADTGDNVEKGAKDVEAAAGSDLQSRLDLIRTPIDTTAQFPPSGFQAPLP